MKKGNEEKRLKKVEILQLNKILSEVKVGVVSNDTVFNLLTIKIELSKHVKDLEAAQRLASEELKPEGLKKEGVKDKTLEEEWNTKMMQFMDKHLSEEIPVKFPRIVKEDLAVLVKENNLMLGAYEVLNILV